MSPFCKIYCGSDVFTSNPCSGGGACPTFDWKVESGVNTATVISIAVLNSDMSKTPIAAMELRVKDIPQGVIVDEWYPLTHGGKPAGSVHLRMLLTPHETSAPAAIPAPTSQTQEASKTVRPVCSWYVSKSWC
jgi:hypothetical protein